jgi:hypothetical protein
MLDVELPTSMETRCCMSPSRQGTFHPPILASAAALKKKRRQIPEAVLKWSVRG